MELAKSYTVTGLPAVLIILVILALVVLGIVYVVKTIKRKSSDK